MTKTLDLSRTYTNAEFEATPEFDGRNELLDGRIVEKPMPGYEHSLIADIIRELYRDFDPNKLKGQMLQEVSVILGPGNVPIPDIAFWTVQHKLQRRTKNAAPLPDLIVEIWSPHDFDTKNRQIEARDKIRKYLLAGVKIAWAINPDKRIVEVYHASQAEPVATLGIADELDGEDVIPGFKLKVADLFD